MSIISIFFQLNDKIDGRCKPIGDENISHRFSLCYQLKKALFTKGIEATGIIDITDIATNRPFITNVKAGLKGLNYRIVFQDDDGSQMELEGRRRLFSFFKDASFSGELRKDNSTWQIVTGKASFIRLIRSLRIRLNFQPAITYKKSNNKDHNLKIPVNGTAAAVIDTLFYNINSQPLKKDTIIKRIEEDIGESKPAFRLFSFFMGLFNLLPLLRYGKTFVRLKKEKQYAFINGLICSKSFIKRIIGNFICLPFKFQYSSSPELYGHLDIPYTKEKINPEPEPRWMEQIFPATSFDRDQTIEAEVVVVGTGAGGAVAAKELAEKGFAVAMIEAGHFYRRDSFDGNPKNMMQKLYRISGVTVSVGNLFMPIPLGKAVGGSTLINSGTCYRAPDDVLNKWVADGLVDFSPEKMAPYFERVEGIINVKEADAKYIGPIGEVIKKGCDAFGYSCGPLHRNAIDCEGGGVCTMGCPLDAKQSTNISYIPRALNAAAQLYTGFDVKDILADGARAIGVRATGAGKDGTYTLTCFAKSVILSCGALITPGLIQKNHLKRGNRWIGKNLTVHPAGYVSAIFPDRDMKNPYSIPQGFMIDEFFSEGIMFEGATAPCSIINITAPGIGKEYAEVVNSYKNLAMFGYMIKDTSKGYVRSGIGDIPFIYYGLNKNDKQRLIRAMHILSEIFFAAGAKKVFLPTFNHPVVDNQKDLETIINRNWKAKDMLLSAYHPIGTARIGLSENDSAIDTNHQCHRVPGLFVVDGSCIPTSLGVNPQVTIMTIATMAAEKIAKLLN